MSATDRGSVTSWTRCSFGAHCQSPDGSKVPVGMAGFDGKGNEAVWTTVLVPVSSACAYQWSAEEAEHFNVTGLPERTG